ncbi:hypothetical protein PENSPDRAFT_357467 [Peniophora sp. CONT]|nr:hypothetical protein PENSPDRAFT_357467 [Peniophora sp. CONT]
MHPSFPPPPVSAVRRHASCTAAYVCLSANSLCASVTLDCLFTPLRRRLAADLEQLIVRTVGLQAAIMYNSELHSDMFSLRRSRIAGSVVVTRSSKFNNVKRCTVVHGMTVVLLSPAAPPCSSASAARSASLSLKDCRISQQIYPTDEYQLMTRMPMPSSMFPECPAPDLQQSKK